MQIRKRVMIWFSCPCLGFRRKRTKSGADTKEHGGLPSPDTKKQEPVADDKGKMEPTQIKNKYSQTRTFKFRELAAATKNFRKETLVGEGGFGRVYKGILPGSGQVVAVKQLDKNGLHANKDFETEVLPLSLLEHQNLVNLVGYCADGDQRHLVYEFVPGGTVQDHLFDVGPNKPPMDWFTRMKIASGTAEGLEYLHDKVDPPVIYRDLKASNILLDKYFKPKLSDYGSATLGPTGNSIHVSSMETFGYTAPECRDGEATTKSDVYSFGVVLLELITGRRAMDTTKPSAEQNLVSWAQPLFRDPKNFPDMADPLLNKRFPEKDLNQVVAIAAMCLQDEPSVRPLMCDVVSTLSFIKKSPDEGGSAGDSSSTGFASAEEDSSDDAEEGLELDCEVLLSKRASHQKRRTIRFRSLSSRHENKTTSPDGSVSKSHEGSQKSGSQSGSSNKSHHHGNMTFSDDLIFNK